MANHARFKSLEARMDAQLHAFRSSDEEESGGSGLARTAGLGVVGAAGAAGAGAAYRNRAALQTGAQDLARTGLKKTARAAGVASNAAHRQAIRGKNPLLKKAGAAVATPLGRVATRLRGVARGFSAGEAEQIACLAERIAVLELEAEEELIEFNLQNSYRAREKFSDAGHHYRVRDEQEDRRTGARVGLATTAGLTGGAVLGGRAVMKATAARKVPKGALRQGAVSASKSLRKISKRTGLLAAGALAAGVAGNLAGGTAERRAADKRLAQRQAGARGERA